MAVSVEAWQRWTAAKPCPVCAGNPKTAQGRGERCFGFVSGDGAWAHCTRPEFAQGLKADSANTYSHRLAGACRCGVSHVGQPDFASCLDGPSSRFEIRDADGTLVAVHRRTEAQGAKRMWWETATGSSGLCGTRTDSLPLFGTELLETLPDGAIVIVCEGEKATLAARNLGWAAVGTVTGAGSCPASVVLRPLARLTPVLWPDNDEVGRAHMSKVGAALVRLGTKPKQLSWAEAPEKGDAADLAELPGAAEMLAALVAAAEPPANTPSGDPAAHPNLDVVCLADVERERVEWLWRGYVPFGKLTILDGDPGLGKSQITLDIAARFSTGRPMPFDRSEAEYQPGNVLLLSVEDGLADTIRPRLEAAGADLTRIHAWRHIPESHGERPIEFPLDGGALRARVIELGVKLVIIDPLMAFLGSDTNSYNDQHIRKALHPLAVAAQETGAALIAVRHLTKSGGSAAIYRGGGSIGIIAAARSGLLVAKDPDDPTETRRVFAQTKGNLGPTPVALTYRIEAADDDTSRVIWEGASEHTASTLLAQIADEAASVGALGDAKDFLLDALSGAAVTATQIQHQAKEAGIAPATLQRAKKALRISARKDGYGKDSAWHWALPSEGDHESPKAITPTSVIAFDEVDHLRGKPTPKGNYCVEDGCLRIAYGHERCSEHTEESA